MESGSQAHHFFLPPSNFCSLAVLGGWSSVCPSSSRRMSSLLGLRGKAGGDAGGGGARGASGAPSICAGILRKAMEN